ncbi:MAG TPA: hypothetical protein VHZ07_12155 [Bryobacteraceae bacterium]|jgi:hypothetical protein|nr:hypothetical protein [Bryobacteraceae bacterium]
MKLRLRRNSIRLRLNRRDVDMLASGNTIEEQVFFPGDAQLSYVLESRRNEDAAACFDGVSIRIAVPSAAVSAWANSQEIGLYYDFAAGEQPLKVAIEKDLECLHPPEDEHDAEAFPRT